MVDVEEVIMNEWIRVQHELEHSIGKYFTRTFHRYIFYCLLSLNYPTEGY